MKFLKIILLSLIAFSTLAFAQDSLVSPDASAIIVDTETGEIVQLDAFAKSIIDLVKDYKSLGGLAAAMAILNLLMMLLKTKLFGSWLDSKSRNVKKLVLVILGQALGVLAMITAGLSPLSAIMAGLITSGGANLIYKEIKDFKKSKAEKK